MKWNTYAKYHKPQILPNTQPSLTIPDQSMTVDELYKRYAAGLPLEGRRVPFYTEDNEFLPNLKKLDLAEIEHLKIESQKKIEHYKQQLLDVQAKKRLAEEEARIREAAEKLLKEKEVLKPPQNG